MEDQPAIAPIKLPRIAITYCTQCKWMLRAAYFGQELLSTFGTTVGEIALIPATGGIFTVHLSHLVQETRDEERQEIKEVLIWDRKAEGGFPETKILKQRIRNHVDPEKKLGHSDTPSSKTPSSAPSRDGTSTEAGTHNGQPHTVASTQNLEAPSASEATKCEDCQ